MAIEKVKCTECGNLILPQTAAENDGLCAPCAKIPESLRKEMREFEARIATGVIFTPSSSEIHSARPFLELANPKIGWNLEPNFYAASGLGLVADVIAKAKSEREGDVFLVSNSNSRLNLSFNQVYGVCEHQDSEGHSLHAYSPLNLRQQVSGELHIGQPCPCCGVGIGWYPSCLHMPRTLAFNVFESFLSHSILEEVVWIDTGDPSHTVRGHG